MKAYISSVGFTNIGDQWEKSLLDLAVEAATKALAGTPGLKPEHIFVGNMFSSYGAGQEHLGALLASALGFEGMPAVESRLPAPPVHRPSTSPTTSSGPGRSTLPWWSGWRR